MPDDRAAKPADRWGLVAALALAHCLAFADRILIALVAPAIKATLHLTDFQIGLLQGAAFVVAYALASLAFGALADARGRISLVMISLLVSAFATGASGFASSFAGLALARLAMGLGQSVLSPAALSLITQILPGKTQGRGVSVYTAGSTLGRSVALVGGGALVAALPAIGVLEPWRVVFLVAVLPNIVLALVFAGTREPPRPGLTGLPRAMPSLSAWLTRHRRFYLTHTIAASATVLVIQTVTAWTTTLLVRRHGLSIGAAGGVFGIIVLVAAPLGHLVGGAILDRLARALRRPASTLVIATSLATAVPLTALFGCADDLKVSVAALILLTLTMGIAGPAGFLGIQARTPRRLRGRATAAFLFCVTTLGFGLGPASLGLLTDRVFGAAGIGTALFCVVTVAALVGVTSALIQAHTPRKKRGMIPPSRPTAIPKNAPRG